MARLVLHLVNMQCNIISNVFVVECVAAMLRLGGICN